MGRQLATVFGGSGFLGRYVVKRLAQMGYTVRIAVRDVEAGMHLKPNGNPGQIILQACNVRNEEMVAKAVEGASVVVNLVGILSPWGKQTFDSVHADGAAFIAQASAKEGVENLIHISAIGADANAEANYAKSKGMGEDAVKKAFPNAVILRPSVVFGREDGFFNKFASMARFSPALPVMGVPFLPQIKFENGELDINLFGDGGAKMQPVYVGDVALAVVKSIDNEEAKGKIFELGGPEIMTFLGIMKRVLKHTKRKRLMAPVSFPIAKIMGAVMGLLPNPVITSDQVLMLESDNVVPDGSLTLKDLGIEPTLADVILPTYLDVYREQKDQVPNVENGA